MINNLSITKEIFEKECEIVCHQLKCSGSSDLDREMLYFAVYWKICDFLDRELIVDGLSGTNISMFRRQIERFAQDTQVERFDVLSGADKMINHRIRQIYDMTVATV